MINFLEEKKDLNYDEKVEIPKELKLCRLKDLKIDKEYIDETEHDEDSYVLLKKDITK